MRGGAPSTMINGNGNQNNIYQMRGSDQIIDPNQAARR